MIQLNPLDAISLESISNALCASDRLAECLQYRLKLQQLHPDYGGVNSSVGMARAVFGRPDRSPRQHGAGTRRRSQAGRARGGLCGNGTACAVRCGTENARGRFAATSAYEIAQIHAYRGEADRAFEWLQRSYQRHDSEIVWIKTDPLLRGLHGDRRFRALLTQLRLPE